MIDLYQGDCLMEMGNVASGSVDLILCDLPYGTTACKWDAVIPFAPLWDCYRRILKPTGAVVLTASQPFTAALLMSNPKWFKYAWVWHKSKATGFQDVHYRPLKAHEDVLVFSPAGCSTGSKPAMQYNPQGLIACNKKRSEKKAGGFFRSDCKGGGVQTQTNWPQSVQKFASEGKPVHPTQKPLALMEYMVSTYTQPGGVVMDNCMGSGTTGVACIKLGRDFIGIEKDYGYFSAAKQRIYEAQPCVNNFPQPTAPSKSGAVGLSATPPTVNPSTSEATACGIDKPCIAMAS